VSDPETIATYDARATAYAEHFSNTAPDADLQAFIDALPDGGDVLDLGCGPAHSAAMMQRAGLCVTAWDASAEMVALARRLHGIEAEQKTFDALEYQQTFDGVWANFSLLHAPRQDFRRHLKAIHAALKNGGLLHLGLKTGTGSKRDTLGRLYTFFTPTELTDHLHSTGFTPIASRQGREVGLAGTEDPFIILRATR